MKNNFFDKNTMVELRKTLDFINNNPKQLISSEVLNQLQQIKKIQDTNQISFGIIKSFNEALKPLNNIKYPSDILLKMKDITTEVYNSDSMKEMRKFAQSVSDSIQKMSKAFELPPELKRSLEEFRKAYSHAHKELARHSWYFPLSLRMTDEIEVFAKFRIRDIDGTDAIMLKLLKSNLKQIKIDLIRSNPDRKEVISEGFHALKSKMYYAAICIFLSQSDGIFGGKLFKNRNDKRELKDFFKANEINSWADMIIAAVDTENTIDTYHGNVKNSDKLLNRHGILHGIYFDYGTELNAFKALSLLAFVSQIMDKSRTMKEISKQKH